jgi:uncharacterized protein (DUF433 family)
MAQYARGMALMANFQQVEQWLDALTPDERAQLIVTVARGLGDAASGIDRDPAICGGEPCIIRTRIPVWVLVQSRRLGMSEAEILRSYPTLRAQDLVNAWAYEELHQEEIDRQIIENEEA